MTSSSPGPIGTSPLRKEDRRLLLGADGMSTTSRDGARCTSAWSGALHGHARLTRVDASEQRAPCPAWCRVADADGPPRDRANIPTAAGDGAMARPLAPPGARAHVVRYVGEPVAVVVAESAYQLADALER